MAFPNTKNITKGVQIRKSSLISLFFIIGLLTISPRNYSESNALYFVILSGLLVGVRFLLSMKRNNTAPTLTVMDLFFIGFLMLSFLSVSWATNEMFALRKSMHWLMIYLFYRCLEDLRLDYKDQLQIEKSFSIFLLVSLGVFGYLYLVSQEISFRKLTNLTHYFFGNINYFFSNWLLIIPMVILNGKGKWNFFVVGIAIVIILMANSQAVKIIFVLAAILIVIAKGLENGRKQKAFLFIGLISLIAIYIIMDQAYSYSSLQSEIAGLGDRYVMWSKSLELWKSNFWSGVGSGNWIVEVYCTGMEEFNKLILTRTFTHAHSIYFETLAELGIIGFILLLGILFYPLFAFWKIRNKTLRNYGYLACYLAYLLLCNIYGVVYMQTHYFAVTPFIAMYAGNALINSSDVSKINVKINRFLGLGLTTVLFIWFSYLFVFNTRFKSIRTNPELTKPQKKEQLIQLLRHSPISHLRSPRSSIYPTIIRFANQRKEFAVIDEWYKKALDLDPCNTKLILEYAKYLNRQKYYSRSMDVLLSSISVDARNELNYVLIGKNYAGLGYLEKADSIYHIERKKLDDVLLNRARFKQELIQSKYPDSTFQVLPKVRKTKHETIVEKSLKELETLLKK